MSKKLYFRHGPMNSGKTISLLSVAHNYERNGKKVLLIKPGIDTKAGLSVISRIGPKRKVDVIADKNTDLLLAFERHNKTHKISCVLIDEAQFLTKRHVNQLHKIATSKNCPVIAYGLRSDFLTNMFPGSKRLFELSHSIEELKTVCECERKAIFNARKVNGKFVSDGEQNAIDGEDQVSYEPLCSECYIKFVGEKAFIDG